MTTVYGDIQTLEPGAEVVLFNINCEEIGGTNQRFHGYTQLGVIFWQGEEYAPWPIVTSGFGRTGGKPPTPTVELGNVDGSISALCLVLQDMVGAKLEIKKTFGKYLDEVNFGVYITGDDPVLGGAVSGAGWALLGPAGAEVGVQRTGGTSGYARLYHAMTEPGRRYRLQFDVTGFSGDSAAVYDGGSQIGEITGNGSYDIEYVALGTTNYLEFREQYVAAPGNFTTSSFTRTAFGSNPTADPDQHFPDEVWYVERKANEDYETVSFELASVMDFNGIKLPRRQIIPNFCHAKVNGGYRGPYCGYTGGPVATVMDVATSDPALDNCSGKLTGCRFRFTKLPFGAFPAAGLLR